MYACKNTGKLHFFVNIVSQFYVNFKSPSGFSSFSNKDIIIQW